MTISARTANTILEGITMSERTTLLLDDRQAFRDEIKRLEIEHNWALEARKTDLHTAIVAVGLEDHSRLRRKLREIQSECNIPACMSCGGANHLSESPHCRDCILERIEQYIQALDRDVPREIGSNGDARLKLLLRDERVDSDVFQIPSDENKSAVQGDEDQDVNTGENNE